MNRRASLALLGILTALACAGAASAENWPRFRGPNGTGIASADLPVRFGDKENIVWKTALPGVGHSSPIVWEKRVFLQSSEATGKERWLLCIDADSGKLLWKSSVEGARGHTHRKNSLASSTPATDGERVYVIFWDGQTIGMYAYDLEGKLVWKRDLGSFTSQHGPGGSPMVHDGKVYYANDQDGSANLIALDCKTGEVAWKAQRRAFRACYTTPFLWEDENGSTQLIVGSTAGLTGYDPKTGKEIWDYRWTFTNPSKPLRSVNSPVVNGGIAFHGSGDGAGDRHLIAVKLGGKGDVTKDALVWEKTKFTPYVPCMLSRGDYVYGIHDDGFAACYEAKTGKEVWRERLSSKVTSSPVLVGDLIYAVGDDGTVFVYKAEPVFSMVAKNSLNEPVSASPAVANNRLFIRTQGHLICIGKSDAQ